MMFSAVALEPIFLRLPPDIAWSHVLTLQLGLTFIVANVLYTSIYPLDRLLQRSAFQAKGSAGRVAIWSGLALVSVACVVRVAFGVVSMIFF